MKRGIDDLELDDRLHHWRRQAPAAPDMLVRNTVDQLTTNRKNTPAVRIAGWQVVAATVLLAANIGTALILTSQPVTAAATDPVDQWIDLYSLDVPTLYTTPVEKEP